ELIKVLERDAAPGLLFVKKGFGQQRSGEDLVAWRVKQIGTRNMRGADRLALAAAQAVLDRFIDLADRRLLHDQRLGAEQREGRRVSARQVGARHQLALIETALRIDLGLVGPERRD